MTYKRFFECFQIVPSTAVTIPQTTVIYLNRFIGYINERLVEVGRQDRVPSLFSLFAELERDLISLRTKEALAAKKPQGVAWGKPKGTIRSSQFDKDRGRIKELLGLGLSVRKITKLLGYTNHLSLNTYVRKRGLRETVR